MIRLLLLSLVFATLAGVVLLRLGGGFQLAAWLLVVAAAATVLLRDLPSSPTPPDPSLRRRDPDQPSVAPRYWAEASLVVRSAIADEQAGRRRLRPHLRRIAEHRLARRGLKLGSPRAAEMLGDEALAALEGRPGAIDTKELAAVLDRLERL